MHAYVPESGTRTNQRMCFSPDILYEMIDSEYVEKSAMGAAAEYITNTIAWIINCYTFQTLGRAYSEMLISLPGCANNRRPDVVYVDYDTWSKGKIPPIHGPWAVLPQICIEIISPTDDYETVMEKKDEYFRAGVREVWILSPTTKDLQICTSPTRSCGYRSPDIVDCSELIPGFQLNLGELL